MEITRRIEFDAAHRVVGHEGKCRFLHGHRYAAEVTARSGELDELGRVIDYSTLKEVIGGWIDENWDHRTILNENDEILLDPESSMIHAEASEIERICGRYPFIMPNGNPTAENLATVLLMTSRGLLADYPGEIIRVRIYETPNCWADAE